MDTTKRTNQGGSIAVFLIVSVVLAAGVIGGMYFVQQRGAHVRTNEPISQTNPPKPADEQKKPAEEQKPSEEEKKQAEQQKAEAEKQAAAKKQEEQQKKAEADKQAAAAEAEKKRQAEQQAAAPAPPSNIPQTSTAPTAGNLPQTGPEDSMPQVLAGAILLGVLIAYLKSYRHRFGSLFR